MMKVSPLGSGPAGSLNKTGYGQLHFPIDALTFLSAENLIHAVNSGSGVSWFGVYNLQHPFWLPITKGDKGRTMAWRGSSSITTEQRRHAGDVQRTRGTEVKGQGKGWWDWPYT